MKKKTGKLLLFGAVILTAAGITAGCRKEASPENLLGDMDKNLESAESSLCNMRFFLDLGTGTENMQSISMDIDLETIFKEGKTHGAGSTSVSVGGEQKTTDMELYSLTEDGQVVMYTGTNGTWTMSTAETTMSDDILQMTEAFGINPGNFMLSEEPSEVNGEECFHLNGTLEGENVAGLLNSGLMSASSQTGLSEESLQSMVIPCTIDIYKNSILPAYISIDLKDTMNTLLSGNNVQVTNYYIEITYMEYDTVDEISVPDDVAAAAVSGTGTTGDTTEGQKAEAAEASGDLGSGWTSYTVQINSKVITLPCSVSDLEAAGLSLDTEYTPENYVVNAKEYELAWFVDKSGNEIEVYFINDTDAAKEIKDCAIAGIGVYSYDVEDGALSVILPGGITIGSTVEDAKKAYGEPSDVYEDKDYGNLYYWYEGDSYFNECILSTDAESGLIDSLTIERLDDIY